MKCSTSAKTGARRWCRRGGSDHRPANGEATNSGDAFDSASRPDIHLIRVAVTSSRTAGLPPSGVMVTLTVYES
jgi:hypothetical protein